MSRFINIHTHTPTSRHIEPHGVGIHPWQAEEHPFDSAMFHGAELIGEIGLDYACDVDKKIQEELFCKQLVLAKEMGLPVVIHSVRAFEDVLKLLLKYKLEKVVFHGFIGSVEQAKRAVDKGFFLDGPMAQLAGVGSSAVGLQPVWFKVFHCRISFGIRKTNHSGNGGVLLPIL